MARRRRALLGAVLTLGIALAATGCFTPPRDIDVTIADGPLRGVADDEMRSWLGIPYAAPPVGDLRWRPPEPVEPWSGVRTAEHYDDKCLQVSGTGIAADSSEDCLFLNVFRPDTEKQDLPVMVWIHGGALVLGSGNLPLNAVDGLVEQDMVVVSLNYRLGRLGYFTHPALAGDDGRVANFGLLDQVAALQWVQDNIADFGGDPDAVTIFGISGGGASVNYLMSSPLADGLFAKAISSSGLGREQPATWQQATTQGATLAAGAGVSGADADALREIDAETVVRWPAYQLRDEIPIRDDVLPRSVAETFAAGKEAAVPYIAGSTDLELLDASYPSVGFNPAQQRLRWAAGHEAELAAAYGDAKEFARHFLNDLVFTEPARYLAAQHADAAPTYRYRFEIAADQGETTLGGAIHGADYPYIFGWTEAIPDVENAQELAEGVSECWASFAASSTPSCDGVVWPEAGDGLLAFTNDGPVAHATDPWQQRLDLVAGLREAGPPVGLP